MKWFRAYNDTPNDPKLRRIAHQAGTTVGHTLAVWFSMLCHASENQGEKRGTLAGWDDADCAFNLGIDRAIVFAVRKEMEGRILDGERIIAWSKRQYVSDDAAARKREWREKRRGGESQENQTVSSESTGQARDGHGTVPTKNRTEQNRDRANALSHSAPAESGKRKAAPSVELPGWLPADAWADWCNHRRGKKWTQRAAELSVKELDRLRQDGHDPRAVINQSIVSGWMGLFPVKQAQRQDKPSRGAWAIEEMLRERGAEPIPFDIEGEAA